MAGHSQFKNIMYRKGAQDKKRAKIFNKLAREITVAVKSGQADPAINPRLRAAITAAREANMPRDRIERTIKSAAGEGDDAADYEEIRYEGYGPGGIALIVEALTDNRNRTASEVRMAFSKHDGALGETNSVSFMFKKQGVITYPVSIGDFDAVFEAAVEAGADNIETIGAQHQISTVPDDLSIVRDALEKKFGPALSSSLVWQPLNTIEVSGDTAAMLLKLIEALEDSDDVQNVFGNFDIDENEIERLTA